MATNRITVYFKNTDWKKEFLKKDVLFNEAGHSFEELEEDVNIISEKEYFGCSKVEMDIERWVASVFHKMKGISKIECEGKEFVKGAGRFVLDDMHAKNDTLSLSLYDYLS